MSTQSIQRIVANKPAAVTQAPVVAIVEPVVQSEIIRPIELLANQYKFDGELATLSGDITMEESIRLSVSLVNSGEQSRARGIYVAASKLRGIGDKKEAETFKASLRAQFVMEAKEAIITAFYCSLPSGVSNAQVNQDGSRKLSPTEAKRLEMAKTQAETEAGKRYDNVSQALRAAVWALNNPDKLADSLSVFTLTQANKYLEAPGDKAEDKEQAEFVRAKVLPLLKKGTTTQAVIKDAIKEAKAKFNEKPEAPDTRTPDQKAKEDKEAKQAELVKRTCYLADKIRGVCEEWSLLMTAFVEGGSTMEAASKALRGHYNVANDPSKGTIATRVSELARLAGLEVKQP